jgi:hypothetical protein
MLGYTKAKLYELIPQIYRQHDAISGKPLEALISIIARQVDVLEKDIAGLYDNWFVETCDEWVTAYLADLVGARSLATSRVSSTSATTAEVSQRAYVANTLGYASHDRAARKRHHTVGLTCSRVFPAAWYDSASQPSEASEPTNARPEEE